MQHAVQKWLAPCRTTPSSQVTVKLLSSSLEPHQTHDILCMLAIGTSKEDMEALLGKKGIRDSGFVSTPNAAPHSQGTCNLLKSIARIPLGRMNVFHM